MGRNELSPVKDGGFKNLSGQNQPDHMVGGGVGRSEFEGGIRTFEEGPAKTGKGVTARTGKATLEGNSFDSGHFKKKESQMK